MRKEICIDLRVGRREAGLSNEDLAHLLATTQSRISRLENGRARLRTSEIITLCMIYGRDAEHLFTNATRSIMPKIQKRLGNIPPEPSNWQRKHDARLDTLNGLFNRLNSDYGATD
jgi:transcriptional regulator with XRE-family HTH domain